MNKQNNIPRLISIAVFYIVIVLVYIGRLLYLQVSGQDYYSMSTPSRSYKRTAVIQAQRGEIYDRNGTLLVGNHYIYRLSLDYSTEPKSDSELNDMILSARSLAAQTGNEDKLVNPKASLNIDVTEDGLEFSYPDEFLTRLVADGSRSFSVN